MLDQWPDALADLDAQSVELAASLLDGMTSIRDVRVAATDDGGGRWRVGVCLGDRVGALSLVCGLFTASGLDIRRADTFSVVQAAERGQSARRLVPRSRGGRRLGLARRRAPRGGISVPIRRAVMLFELSESLSEPDWAEIESDLKWLLDEARAGRLHSARSSVIERFSNAMRNAERQPSGNLPMRISTDAETSSERAALTILSEDTPGFLFAFTNALASLRVNVVRARVRTDGEQVRDTFWFTDASGRKIESEDRLRQIRVAAALIRQFAYTLPSAPDPGQALRQFDALTGQMLSRPDWTSELNVLESPGVLETLAELLGVSRFLWEDFLRMQHDNLFPILRNVAALDTAVSSDGLAAALRRDMDSVTGHERRARALNDFKDREMFRCDLRYITGRIDQREFGRELSRLAGVVVRGAFDLSAESVRARVGVPRLADGSECDWGIFALGKFGGEELGFGSDIELLFVYRAEGRTDGAEPVRVSTYFEEVVRGFLAALETRRDGIFEVDMRLRPYGSKGALASSLESFADYYSTGGDARHFERLALVRMRHVAGDVRLAAEVMRAQEAFVYSSAPVDVEDIRHLRRRQASELVRRGAVNAKLSPGGLVDIEYYAQARQIVAGRRDRSVRVTNTLDAVAALGAGGHIAESEAERIGEACRLIRRVIDALRVVRGNAKDLDIPPVDSREFRYLAHRLGVNEPSRLDDMIREQMALAAGLWEDAS